MARMIFTIIGLALLIGIGAWTVSLVIGDALAEFYMNNFDLYNGPDEHEHRKVIVRNFMIGIITAASSVALAILILL